MQQSAKCCKISGRIAKTIGRSSSLKTLKIYMKAKEIVCDSQQITSLIYYSFNYEFIKNDIDLNHLFACPILVRLKS